MNINTRDPNEIKLGTAKRERLLLISLYCMIKEAAATTVMMTATFGGSEED